MRWFIPSWNGDVRFEPAGDGKSSLVTADLTALERVIIAKWAEGAAKSGWIDEPTRVLLAGAPTAIDALTVNAPVPVAAAAMAKLLRYNAKGVITAFSFAGGKVQVTEAMGVEKLPRWARKATEALALPSQPAAPIAPAPPAPPPAPEPEAAVTVRRPSLSCPECLGKPERVRMACDVLWEFLDVDQRKEWKRKRAITAFGSLTGHAYRLHPRDSLGSVPYGRVAFDMDDRVILHNFAREVPPEEELLTVKLLLEHRENWLRVHGEVDPASRASPGTIFDNPFFGEALLGF